MKGSALQFYMFLVIVFLIVGIILIFAGRKVINVFTSEFSRKSAEMLTREIAGIINTLYISPNNTEVSYLLPEANCTINITERYVYVSTEFKGIRTFSERPFIIDESINVIPSVFYCNNEYQKSITFHKIDNKIYIKEK